jgi:nucleoid DNA-binding protein
MDIARIIQDLLYKDNSVSIPGLGTFSIIYKSSELLKYSNQITPPSYQIYFTENFDTTDNKITSILSEEYDLPFENALEIIENWVKEIKEILKEEKSFSIKNIGVLNDVSGIINFEADTNSPLTAGNFGLENVKIPLIEIEPEKTETHKTIDLPVKPKASNKKIKWIAALFAILIIVSAGFIAFNLGYFDKAINELSLMTGFDDTSEGQQLATNDTLKGKIDANKLKRNALKYNENKKNILAEKQQKLQKQKVLKYYIIAGSFKSFKSANKFKNDLVFGGFSPEILNIGDTTFRVALSSFSDRHKAVEEYIMLTTQDAKRKIWLYSQLTQE